MVFLFDLCIALPKIVYLWTKEVILFFIPISWRSKSIAGEIVLITGSGSGLGQLMAIRFAEKGARVVLWDVNQIGLEETERRVFEAGGKAYSYLVDITNKELVYETAKRVKDDVGNVTILVNNAGIVTGNSFMDQPDHKIIKTFEVNTISHFWTLKSFLPYMQAQNKGHIVTIASCAGITGAVRLTDYCGSKFGAVGLHEALYLELQAEGYQGISTTLVCPFFINTGMFDGVQGGAMMPVLTPEFVVKKIMNAVLTDQLLLIMPRLAYMLPIGKAFVPVKALTVVHSLLGGFKYMKNFKGREQQKNGTVNTVSNLIDD